MYEVHPMSANKCSCDFTQMVLGRDCEVCVVHRVEDLLNDVRAEIGNAGFAAAVGESALVNEALTEAIRQIEVVREHLANHS